MNTKGYRASAATVAVLIFAAAAANGFALGRLTLGVKGGFDSANLRIETDTTIASYQTVNRFAWGGFLGYRITNNISLQVEVLDSPKGSLLRETIGGFFTDTTLKYDYTEIPLLVRFSESSRSRLTPSFYAGPYYAILRKAEGTFSTSSGTVTEPLEDQRKNDFGLVFGAALTYKLGAIALVADVRYDLGLTDVDRAPGSTFNHRVLSVMVGFGI